MKQHNRKIIYLAGFLFSITIALTSYINSSFLASYINPKYVGVVYIVASAITIVLMLQLHKLLTKRGNRNVALIISIALFLALILLSFSQTPSIIIAAFILYFLANNFMIASLDVFMENLSEHSSIGRFRGFYLTVTNSAWVIAQMISGSVISKSSYQGVYLLSAGFMILVSMIFVLFLKDFKDLQYKKIPILRNIKIFAENKNVSRIYLINLILKFFFAWMIIYTPIYLHEYMNFGWDKIGIIFTFMLLPFVILEFPLGKLSDKIGERKMLIIGFSISAVATLIIPLITLPKIFLWAGILFATRVGAATIEIMSESYFFKSIEDEDAEATSFFRNTTPLSFILAPLVATPLLILIPSFKYLFFVLAAILFYGLFLTLKLKDVK